MNIKALGDFAEEVLPHDPVQKKLPRIVTAVFVARVDYAVEFLVPLVDDLNSRLRLLAIHYDCLPFLTTNARGITISQ